MSGQSDPYVRVYYSIIPPGDARFERVYMDDGALATWLRLLLAADAMYPAPAALPRWVRDRSLALLVDAGIVELLPAHHFRIHGLAAERARRSESARNAAALRWHGGARSARNAPRNATTMLAEPSRAEPSRENERLNSSLTSVSTQPAAVEPLAERPTPLGPPCSICGAARVPVAGTDRFVCTRPHRSAASA